MRIILFKSSTGKAAYAQMAQEIEGLYDMHQIARQCVPQGQSYKIVDMGTAKFTLNEIFDLDVDKFFFEEGTDGVGGVDGLALTEFVEAESKD